MSKNNFFQSLYDRLININDSPQKIAAGFALGVFLGIFPGAGPVASIVLSSFFRINSIAALTGSLLTNTWISIVTFALAIKIGAVVTGADWEALSRDSGNLIKDFNLRSFFDVSILRTLYPVFIGYILIGFILAAGTYLLVLIVFKLKKARRL